MMRTLLTKAFRDARLLLAALALVMLFFPWLYAWATSMISLPAFSEFLSNALPKQWQSAWGVPISEVAKPSGRMALVFVHPLVMFSAVVWAITRGSDVVAGEIGRGTMEMLLAQPVRRTSLYASHALVTLAGSALLAACVWSGTAIGLRSAELYANVPPTIYLPPAINLFGLMVGVSGFAALVSACTSQRWHAVGITVAWYVVSAMISVASSVVGHGQHWRYLSLLNSYKPQLMVARQDAAWNIFRYRDEAIAGLGLGGHQAVLIAVGLLCYVAGAVVFSRREIPAPI